MKGLLFLFLLAEVPGQPAMIIGKRSVDGDTKKKCLTSPGYPNNYPNNSHTKQSLSVAGQAIEITWSHFDVEADPMCSYDYLEFFDGNENPVFQKFCGNNSLPTLTISTSTASVVFHSDRSIQKKGFKFCYETGVPSQYLSSSNYPKDYPNSQDFNQTMSVENGASIRVTFYDFQIETHSSCDYDYVQFCDEKGICSDKMCGPTQPEDFTIRASKATVVFHSDNSVTQRGFLLSYRAVCSSGAVNSFPCFCEDAPRGSGEACTGGERCNKDVCTPDAVNSSPCFCELATRGTGEACTGGERCNKDGICQPAQHYDCSIDPLGEWKCPENSGCFNDEVGQYGPAGQQGFCHCFLGFYPDNSTYPPTCIDMRNGGNCDENGNGYICYENDKHWEWCPYCSAKKHHDDHGGHISLGYYLSGEGDFYYDDPQKFRNGDTEMCPGTPDQIGGTQPQRATTDVYWYCWYTVYPYEIVPLESLELQWFEADACYYGLYVYTPLACCWADPRVSDPENEC